MKAGQFDRYFQFTRITRRERRWTPGHQPEHTARDINMAYVDQPDFFALVDGLLAHIFRKALGVELKTPVKALSYDEAILKYGTDRVEARFGLEIADIPDFAGDGTGAGPGGTVTRAFRAPGAAEKLDDAAIAGLVAAGAQRLRFGRRLGLVDEGRHEPFWVHSYPFLDRDEWDRTNLVARVVVFSQVLDEDIPIALDPEKRGKVRAKALDLMLDGVEIANGYIGNCNLQIQRMIWQELCKLETSDLFRLRAPIESHRFGVTPHGGLNVGWNRLLGIDEIDEVMAFPKTDRCRDLFLDAPGPSPRSSLTWSRRRRNPR